jgi:hypothetical protein
MYKMYSKRKVQVYPYDRKQLTLYQRVLNLLCWIKLIPVTRDHETGDLSFDIFSCPTLVSSLWCWVPLTYYLYNVFCGQLSFCGAEENATNIFTTNLSSKVVNTNSPGNNFDKYIVAAFLASIFLLILLLPPVLGNFSALNPSVMLHGSWPKRGWMLVLALFIFLGTETTMQAVAILRGTFLVSPTEILPHKLASFSLLILAVCTIQLISLFLICSAQTDLIKTAIVIGKTTSVPAIRSLLQNYEKVRQGVGPFYMLEFAVHAPILLCWSFRGLANLNEMSLVARSCGYVTYSFLFLVHMCFTSEDCYEAMQALLPSIRYHQCWALER